MQRKGEDLAGENTLTVGDTLLLQGTWVALDRHLSDPNVLVIDHPELFRRQAVPFGAGAGRALDGARRDDRHADHWSGPRGDRRAAGGDGGRR